MMDGFADFQCKIALLCRLFLSRADVAVFDNNGVRSFLQNNAPLELRLGIVGVYFDGSRFRLAECTQNAPPSLSSSLHMQINSIQLMHAPRNSSVIHAITIMQPAQNRNIDLYLQV